MSCDLPIDEAMATCRPRLQKYEAALADVEALLPMLASDSADGLDCSFRHRGAQTNYTASYPSGPSIPTISVPNCL